MHFNQKQDQLINFVKQENMFVEIMTILLSEFIYYSIMFLNQAIFF